MTRLELLVAAAVLFLVCALSGVPSGYEAADCDPMGPLAALRGYGFPVSAGAIAVVGLLLEDGRRRDLAKRRDDSPDAQGPRS
jgi:hypothetical protein